jgi:transcription antitermination factor NusG
LEREGIETLNPLMEAYTSKRGRSSKTLKSLFPSYIFARFVLEKDYPKVRWARGVNKVIGRGREPMPINDVVVEEIKNRIDEDCVVKVFDRWMSKEGRIRVLLSLIGYQTSVQLHYSQVEKVWM